ncbi:MAG: sigma factor [Planctomycetota bacterium]
MTEADPARSNLPSLATRWTRIGALHGQDAEQAWHWFVERYRPFVRGILGGMLGNSAKATAAEDEFWGYVWLSGALTRADRDRRFRAFLSGIVRNFARSFARKRGLPIADELTIDATPARPETTSELQLWVDNVIANAIAALRNESTATATALASFYGIDGGLRAGQSMSASEVADAIGNSTQGVYMLLFRGRKRLRTLIEDELREGCQDQAAFGEELQALLGLAASRLPGLLSEA